MLDGRSACFAESFDQAILESAETALYPPLIEKRALQTVAMV